MPLVGVFALPMFACGCDTGGPLKTQTLSNMKQLVVATLVYASDHDDRLPKDMRDAKVALDQVIAASRIADKPRTDIAFSIYPIRRVFGANRELSGVSLSKVGDPESTIMYFQEGARQDGRLVVGFLDGSTKVLKRKEVSQALRTGGVVSQGR